MSRKGTRPEAEKAKEKKVQLTTYQREFVRAYASFLLRQEQEDIHEDESDAFVEQLRRSKSLRTATLAELDAILGSKTLYTKPGDSRKPIVLTDIINDFLYLCVELDIPKEEILFYFRSKSEIAT